MEIKLYDGKIPYLTTETELPKVSCYPTATWYKLPAVIVLPGGGYSEHADHEAEPIAEFYNARGFHSFILRYRLIPEYYPSAICDLQRLIKYLRANADALRVDENRIFVVGFSAGGHLASFSAVAEDVCKVGDCLDDFDCKPNGVIAGYPVVSSEHPCIKNLAQNDEKALKLLSVEKNITENTPPFLIWHTTDDATVDVKNSLMLGEALKEKGVKFEMHIFPSGEHGLGLAKLRPDISKWADLSADWIIHNFL